MWRSLLKRTATSFAPRRMFAFSANTGQQFSTPQGYKQLIKGKTMSAEDAIFKYIPRLNANVHVQMASAAPQRLLAALANDMQVVSCTTYHMSLEGAAPHMKPEVSNRIRANQFFVGHNGRDAVTRGDADFTPVFFSEVPMLYRRNVISLDTALIHVSVPDAHGWCSLGVSVACDLAAVQSAKHIVAQVNPNMPRTHGDGFIHINQIDAIVECNDPLPEVSYSVGDPVDIAIGKYIAQLIPDGATLQMGIGSIPNAVLSNLRSHRDLGVHTEMFSDGILSLIEAGVVNNKNKKLYPGKNVATFLMGSKKLYTYVDDNPAVIVLDVQDVNNPSLIAQNPLVHGINSAIEVDLTGQVVADSIGTRIFSGVGGQMDFMRGAAQSIGGKPIIALPSTTSKGESRIAAVLKEGAGVVTTRGHVHYVVTEHGIAYLHGKTLRQRAKALIAVADPSHRDRLQAEADKRFGKF